MLPFLHGCCGQQFEHGLRVEGRVAAAPKNPLLAGRLVCTTVVSSQIVHGVHGTKEQVV